MIGVIAKGADPAIVCEFFELFKTLWEPYREGGQYEILLCQGTDDIPPCGAKLILLYGSRTLPFDSENGTGAVVEKSEGSVLSYRRLRLPLYGDRATFRDGADLLVEEKTGRSLICVQQSAVRTVVRTGYDLFEEVRILLTAGQPASHAGIPALDLHICLLRDLIVASGIPLAEIPPVPDGHRFIACLTHDVDHPSIRHHKFDHTAFGFLYRALIGSVRDVLRGRRSVRTLLTNWAAALKLPFVHLGLAKDDWSAAFEGYRKIEGGLCSSFFVIPYKGDRGRTETGLAPARRAARYGAGDVTDQIRMLTAAGCEIGLHGIDAWLDSSKGRRELEQIRSLTGAHEVGVRMHWLYFNEESPATLELAGASYDSTSGYNGAIGYRAGTTQVYRPEGAARLLELPLHIMDTALFYPAHLNLSFGEARRRVSEIIDNAVQFGGCVTINWHDRSIAPERCWGEFYAELVEELRSKGAWFATASDAVSWFRKRRAARLKRDESQPGEAQFQIHDDGDEGLPALCLKVYNAERSCVSGAIAEPLGKC